MKINFKMCWLGTIKPALLNASIPASKPSRKVFPIRNLVAQLRQIESGRRTYTTFNWITKSSHSCAELYYFCGGSWNTGTPKSSISMGFSWIFHYKPSILGIPHLWEPPYAIILFLHRSTPLRPPKSFYACTARLLNRLLAVTNCSSSVGFLTAGSATTRISMNKHDQIIPNLMLNHVESPRLVTYMSQCVSSWKGWKGWETKWLWNWLVTVPHVSFQAIGNSDAVEAKVGDAFHLATVSVGSLLSWKLTGPLEQGTTRNMLYHQTDKGWNRSTYVNITNMAIKWRFPKIGVPPKIIILIHAFLGTPHFRKPQIGNPPVSTPGTLTTSSTGRFSKPPKVKEMDSGPYQLTHLRCQGKPNQTRRKLRCFWCSKYL